MTNNASTHPAARWMQHGGNLELQRRAAFAWATTQNLGAQFRTHVYTEAAICHVSIDDMYITHLYSTYTVYMYETIWSLLWTVRKLQVSWLNKAFFDAVRLYIKYWRTHPFHVTGWIMATVQWAHGLHPSDECKASADLIHHSSWPVKTMTQKSMIVGKKSGTKRGTPINTEKAFTKKRTVLNVLAQHFSLFFLPTWAKTFSYMFTSVMELAKATHSTMTAQEKNEKQWCTPSKVLPKYMKTHLFQCQYYWWKAKMKKKLVITIPALSAEVPVITFGVCSSFCFCVRLWWIFVSIMSNPNRASSNGIQCTSV